jgi:hypothetical protein
VIAGGVTLSVIVSPVVAAVTVGQSSPLHPSTSALSSLSLALFQGRRTEKTEKELSVTRVLGVGHLPSSSDAFLIHSALFLVVHKSRDP